MKNLLYLLIIVIFSILISQAVVSFAALLLTDFNSAEALALLGLPQKYPDYRTFFLLSQGFNNLFVLGVPALITLLYIQKDKLDTLFLKPERLKQTLPLGLILLVTTLPLLSYVTNLNANIPLPDGLEIYLQNLNNSVQEIYDYIANIPNAADFFLTCFVIAVIPAVAEELMFRGLVQPNLAKRLNIHVAIGLTSLIFASIHFQFYYILPRFFISILLGYTFYYTSNLLVPMVIHFVFNAAVLSTLHFLDVDISEGKYSTYENPVLDTFIIILLVSLTLLLLRSLKRVGSKSDFKPASVPE